MKKISILALIIIFITSCSSIRPIGSSDQKSNEATNPDQVDLALDPMSSEKPVDVFIDMMVKDVKVYAGTTPQSDDITALILKRN